MEAYRTEGLKILWQGLRELRGLRARFSPSDRESAWLSDVGQAESGLRLRNIPHFSRNRTQALELLSSAYFTVTVKL